MTFPLAMIATIADLSDANALGAAIGEGPENLTLPLASTEGGPVTHYGAYAAGPKPALFLMILGARAEPPVLPDRDWAAHGLTPERVVEVVRDMLFDAPGSPLDPEGVPFSDPVAHFDAVLAANGLVRA